MQEYRADLKIAMDISDIASSCRLAGSQLLLSQTDHRFL
jgi:hypothetical protein